MAIFVSETLTQFADTCCLLGAPIRTELFIPEQKQQGASLAT